MAQTRLLQFSLDDALYLLMNITSHDVIHDYRAPDSNRWGNVQRYLQQFTNAFTFGLPIETSSSSSNQVDEMTEGGGRGGTITRNQMETLQAAQYYLDDMYDSFANSIKTVVVFAYLQFLETNPSPEQIVSLFENPYYLFSFITQFYSNNENDDINEIFITMADYFWSYLTVVLEKNPLKKEYYNMYVFFIKIDDFLNTSFVDLSIYQNVSLENTISPFPQQQPLEITRTNDISNPAYNPFQQQQQPFQQQQQPFQQQEQPFQQQPFQEQPRGLLTTKEEEEEAQRNFFSRFPSQQPRGSFSSFQQEPVNLFSSMASYQTNYNPITPMTSFGLPNGKRLGEVWGGNKEDKKGGAKVKDVLTIDQKINLVNSVVSLCENPAILSIIDDMGRIFTNVNATDQDKNTYETKRSEIVAGFSNTYNENGAFKTVKCLESIPHFTKPKRNVNMRAIILDDVIRNSIANYITEVKLHNKEQKRIADLEAADEVKRQMGDLTSEDKSVISDFSKLIARMGLYLNGICDGDGNIIPSIAQWLQTLPPRINDQWEKNDLREQISILLPVAEWPVPEDLLFKLNKSYDDNLYDYFNSKYKDPNPDPSIRYFPDSQKLYIVNNASHIPSNQNKNKAFCPLSSIVDGMSLCSWGQDAFQRIEYGDMNFTIQPNVLNPLFKYNGYTIIHPETIQNNLPYEITIGMNVELKLLSIRNEKRVNMNTSNDLKAYVVLRNTLINIINFIGKTDQTTRDFIFTNNKMINNLFIVGMKQTEEEIMNNIDNPDNIFRLILREILFKGVGDLFQEINSVGKFGGYLDNGTYVASPNINPFGVDGNVERHFFANDRPSATRFIKMLKSGLDTQINTKAKGGYYPDDEEKILFVTRQSRVFTGGSKSKKKRKARKKTHYKKLLAIITGSRKRNKNKAKTVKYISSSSDL